MVNGGGRRAAAAGGRRDRLPRAAARRLASGLPGADRRASES